jgi:hypothetical protein
MTNGKEQVNQGSDSCPAWQSRNGGLYDIKVPLVLSPQPKGGFTVTSPLLPELVTEGDTIEEALDNVRDALEPPLRRVRI